jgi:hypothetical protein
LPCFEMLPAVRPSTFTPDALPYLIGAGAPCVAVDAMINYNAVPPLPLINRFARWTIPSFLA